MRLMTRAAEQTQAAKLHESTPSSRRPENHAYGQYEFDVALSFAGEGRDLARTLALSLEDANYADFYDEFEATRQGCKALREAHAIDLGGSTLATQFPSIVDRRHCQLRFQAGVVLGLAKLLLLKKIELKENIASYSQPRSHDSAYWPVTSLLAAVEPRATCPESRLVRPHRILTTSNIDRCRDSVVL
jgi:hypothetical protein